ncbi:MAG: aldo/keto reductase [Acidobacteriota bacterium]|nr:MAG: aldo/keto reductase [Acidobacteriota bacterium]
MDRRKFLQVSVAAVGSTIKGLAAQPMPMGVLGKTGLKVSRFTVGGYHMAVNGEAEATKIIHRAIELGVNFFDSAHHYNDGLSDEIYGRALSGGLRKKVLLMSKAEKRSKREALSQLEDSLRRMKTDYLDLWQCHQVSEMEEVDQILGPDGALEAFVQAKEEGKVRHIGFTGHRDPKVHLRLLEAFDGWETVQHPVNLIDPHYLSFLENVLPRVREKGLGLLAMKSNAMGAIAKNSVASISECLRFAWSQDIDTLVSGVETVAQLEENVLACKTFEPFSGEEEKSLLARTGKGPVGSQLEAYKKPEGE